MKSCIPPFLALAHHGQPVGINMQGQREYPGGLRHPFDQRRVIFMRPIPFEVIRVRL
jgi:hypothetical protein